MSKVLENWMRIWLYAMAVGGIILTMLLVVFWNQFDWIARLFCFTFIGLVLHVLEEWRFPGGFHYVYNLIQKSEIPDRYPMNRVSDMLTNFGALIFGFIGITTIIVYPILAPAIAVASLIFCGVEVLAHTGMGIYSNKYINTKGKKILYNPGFLTSYLVFLPVALGFIYIFVTGIVQTVWTDWFWGLLLMISLGILLIVLPENLLKNKNSPYPFTGKYEYGYYKKFID